jgi:hypothetical protein
LRLGVRVGSIPGRLVVLFAVGILVILRFGCLVLGSTKPEVTGAEKRKVMLMVHVKSILFIVAETARAIGSSMLAGLPLFT